MHKILTCLILITLILLPLGLYAEQEEKPLSQPSTEQGEHNFTLDKKEGKDSGWYWYMDKKLENKTEAEEENKLLPPPTPAQQFFPSNGSMQAPEVPFSSSTLEVPAQPSAFSPPIQPVDKQEAEVNIEVGNITNNK